MSNRLDYIRKFYSVPAKRGMWVRLKSNPHIRGKITGTNGAYLRVRLDGETKSGLWHPLDFIYPIEP